MPFLLRHPLEQLLQTGIVCVLSCRQIDPLSVFSIWTAISILSENENTDISFSFLNNSQQAIR